MNAAVVAILSVCLLHMTITPLSAQGVSEIDLEAIERESAQTVEKPYSRCRSRES